MITALPVYAADLDKIKRKREETTDLVAGGEAISELVACHHASLPDGC
jgi:hypothetical protein